MSGPRADVVALVDLDDGIPSLSNIVECDPAEVSPGLGVEVAWEPPPTAATSRGSGRSGSSGRMMASGQDVMR